MASVFTYDPDPPRITSPWPADLGTAGAAPGPSVPFQALGGLRTPPCVRLRGVGVEKLEPEPQSGPTEYKVHLLLRPRRTLASSSTGQWVSGSHASGRPSPGPGQQRPTGSPREKDATQGPSSTVSGEIPLSVSPLPVPTLQARQLRLQHLTTQLLWRLQQSSPFHASAAATTIAPPLPDVSTIGTEGAGLTSTPPGRSAVPLFPGLAESHGALYEIGVADDGGLVGLARDEMDESVATLRAMATSLGCSVEIRRVIEVGDCSWREPPAPISSDESGKADSPSGTVMRSEPLWVVEAFVALDMSLLDDGPRPHSALAISSGATATQACRDFALEAPDDTQPRTEQMRVALTGATATGKSSLLGTLSTSTLDNGRGKSRLSLLKHHHEIRTGLTSSLAPELLGYPSRTSEAGHQGEASDNPGDLVVNYGCGNVSSWNDIHHGAAGGRLVLWTDSGGHQKYKRTLVRSLISWAPHWVACCIAADGGSGNVDGSIDLSKTHMDLCLQLGLPLLVIITRVDMAVASLRSNLADILASLKVAGRTPVVLQLGKKILHEGELQIISAEDTAEVQTKLAQVSAGNRHKFVPIVLTSAVTGACIGKLHALLRELPLPVGNGAGKDCCRFHTDEIFVKPGEQLGLDPDVRPTSSNDHSMIVLSGLLRYGHLSVGDDLLLGPFPPEQSTVLQRKQTTMQRARSYPARLTSTSLTGSPQRANLQDPRRRSGDLPRAKGEITDCNDPPDFGGEWARIRVSSIRNLRLPQRTLFADQAGTVGISFVDDVAAVAAARLRKGMVVIEERARTCKNGSDGPASGFRARFAERDYRVMEPGALFVVCFASVRACAKIRTVEAVGSNGLNNEPAASPSKASQNGLFEFEPAENDGAALDSLRETKSQQLQQIEVAFHFVEPREWVSVGDAVLVMPSNAVEGSVGLDAFVGRVTAIEP